MSTPQIKQFDPLAGYLAQKDAIDTAIAKATASGWYLIGDELASFEQDFAQYSESLFAIGVANGTDAIELALRAAGIGTGDYVLTTALTAVATATGIVRAGAIPIFVDIDPKTCEISPTALDDTIKLCRHSSITPKAVLVVHLYGQPAGLDDIFEIARRQELLVLEDCAQSHGARFNGKRVGSFGTAATFSFYPTKNLGTFGDAGAVVTSNPEIAESVRRMRQYGWDSQRVSGGYGINSRLDEIHAAVLATKLSNLDINNQRRRYIASMYHHSILSSPMFEAIETCAEVEHVYHQFVVRVKNRSFVQEFLREEGVSTAVHYAKAVHEHPFFQQFNRFSLRLGEAERASREVLSLPMFPELSDTDVFRVAEACKRLAILSDGLNQ